MSLGERIQNARRLAGLSLRALAARVGVSAQAISKYERGCDIPSSKVLIRLSQALGVSVERLLRPATVTLSPPHYRRHKSRLGKKEQYKIQEQIRDWLERYWTVEELVGERLEFQRPKFSNTIQRIEDVEKAAEQLRTVWKLGEAPIPNVISTCEANGVRVGLVAASEHFDTFAFFANESIPVIVVNECFPGDRQRFNIAHEVAHLILNFPSDWDDNTVEKAAYRFAGAFLIPADRLRYELGLRRSHLDIHGLFPLKQSYGMSMSALIRRAYDLGIIGQYLYQKLNHLFRAKGWHKQEPGDPYPREKTIRMEQLVYRALSEGWIGPKRAEELLGKPLKDISLGMGPLNEKTPVCH